MAQLIKSLATAGAQEESRVERRVAVEHRVGRRFTSFWISLFKVHLVDADQGW
jgi:hypothetical protein